MQFWEKFFWALGRILRALAVTGFVLVLSRASVCPVQAVAVGADAVVLVNSTSARYSDFQRSIQPYLDNFGVPYTVLDIATNPVPANLGHHALIIIGHGEFDTNGAALTGLGQERISLAVSNGAGLVNFDGDLATPANAPRYTFVQQIFNFGYGAAATNLTINLPATEPQSQMHFITARHAAGESLALRAGLIAPTFSLPTNVTAVARSGTQPLLAVTSYGAGRAVQWASYSWMSTAVLGPVDGMDDLVWRALVWAARKPFVMRGLPNFLVLRMDDAVGPFWWAHVANELGFKPWIGVFLNRIAETNTLDLRTLVTNGVATTSIHSMDCCYTFFYYNHTDAAPWPDNVMSNFFYQGTQWHTSHGIPISKVVIGHYSEFGPNAFAGLRDWGVEYVGLCFAPGNAWVNNPPWIVGGPYRLYETPRAGNSNLYPVHYADYISIPGHPEFDQQFFSCYTEIRDDASCGEWCPENSDISGSIARGTRQAKRAFDSLVLATLYTHEWYLIPTVDIALHPLMSTNNWRTILQGITNNLAPYRPVYVTYDYACQYVRATRTSRLTGSDYDPGTGRISVGLSGSTDLNLQVTIYYNQSNAIASAEAIMPAFSGLITNQVELLTAPRLTVSSISSNSIALTWPISAPIYELEQSAGLGAAGWVPLTNPPALVNGSLQVITANPATNRFYRLAQP